MKPLIPRETGGSERRRQSRRQAAGTIGVSKVLPVLPIADAQVINTSPGGVAIRTRVPLKPGGRLSFSTSAGLPPILAEILAVEPEEPGGPGEPGFYRVRCRCLLGGFDG